MGAGGRDSNRNITEGKEYVIRRNIKYCNIKPMKRFTKYANYNKNDRFTHARLAQMTKLKLMLTVAQSRAVKILMPSWGDCGLAQSAGCTAPLGQIKNNYIPSFSHPAGESRGLL